MVRNDNKAKTKWLHKLIDKVTREDYRGDYYRNYYGHEVEAHIGAWGIMYITIDRYIRINIDWDLAKVEFTDAPDCYIRATMESLPKLYPSSFYWKYEACYYDKELAATVDDSDLWKDHEILKAI